MDDEGFISEESDYNYQYKLPPTNFESKEITLPLHSIPHKCVYLKHAQISKFNTKYHFNGLLMQCYTYSNYTPAISNGMFDSSFESGNLYAAYEIRENEFDLVLQDDTNTIGYTQWFYFAVHNSTGLPLLLNIVNLMKNYSLLKHELTISIFLNNQWQLLQTNLRVKQSKYYKLKVFQQNLPQYPNQTQKLYQLSFKVPGNYIKYRIALNQPYLIGDLHSFLTSKYEILSKSLSGTNVPLLRFGSPHNDAIVIIARQHPGETVSSWVCQGLLESINQSLTDQFQVLVIPFFNPDGVQWGNFRCDLSGKDLNRVWQKPDPVMHYQVIEAKRLLNSIMETRDIVCFVDLHGHSKKLNSFMYACRGSQDAVQCRVLPHIFSTKSKYFDFRSCTFSLEPCKMKTARAFVYKLVKKHNPDKMHNIFTLETSFFGYSDIYSIKQFSTTDLLQIGRDLYATLFAYYTDVNLRESVAQELEKNRYIYQQQDLHNNEDASDSDPENGLLIQKKVKKQKPDRFEQKTNVIKETGFFKKMQLPLQQTSNFVNARYFSMPKTQNRTMKSRSLHQQFINTKESSADVTPTNGNKLKTQQSANQEQQEIQVMNQFKQSNFQFQKNIIIPPIHNGQSIKIRKTTNPQLSQSFQSSSRPVQQFIHNSPETRQIKHWDPRLIFEFSQKVKRKNTQIKFI